MDAFNDIITRLEKQKQAIDAALAALRQLDETAAVAPEPRAKRAYTRSAVKKSGGISEAGRKSLAEAMKKRWAAKRAAAAAKKTKKKAAKKASAKKGPVTKAAVTKTE
jgi:hypothetical protein